MKLGCIFTIIQLNRSVVHDIEHFISEGNNFMIFIYIYIYIYVYTYTYIYIYIYLLYTYVYIQVNHH